MLLEKQITYQGKAIRTNKGIYTQALFIWSRVPETTLPPSYPGRANFSLISLKNSTNCLHENANSSRGGGGGGGATRVGELSRFGR